MFIRTINSVFMLINFVKLLSLLERSHPMGTLDLNETALAS